MSRRTQQDGSTLTVAELLREWRAHATLTATKLAAGVGVDSSTISRWEAGDRQPDLYSIRALDRELNAGGAFEDLTFALRTPQTLRPKYSWSHNYPPGGSPVWAWVRTPPTPESTVEIVASWGGYSFALAATNGRTGIILTSPTSVANPAATIDLDTAGWVDFGRGTPPPWLPIQNCDVLKIGEIETEPFTHTLRRLAAHVKSLLAANGRSASEFAEFLGQSAGVVASALGADPPETRVWPIPRFTRSHHRQTPSGRRLREIRTGRGYSLREVEALARNLPTREDVPDLTLHELRAAETRWSARRISKRSHLLGRLDVIYRADGDLVCQRLGETATPAQLRFPPYWVGPVWLQLSGREGTTTRFELRWGPHRRLHDTEVESIVTCRQSQPDQVPLHVVAEPLARVSWGIGRRDDAIDINSDWLPVDASGPGEQLEELTNLLLTWVGRTREELDEFLRGGS